MTRTIAITGATGFTGGAILRHFYQLGWRVLAFGRRPNPLLPDEVAYRQWDIGSGPIHIDEPVDVVVHAAAMVDDSGDPALFQRVNVDGTRHVLETFRHAGQFVHISSSSVYDPYRPKEHISEDFPYGERYPGAYGQTKMLAEQTVLDDTRTNKVILRPRAIYGPGDHLLLPRLLKLRRGPFLLQIGDGSNRVSLTYIENLCHAVTCVTERQFDVEIFNIADLETPDMGSLLAQIAEIKGGYRWRIRIPEQLAMAIASAGQRLPSQVNLTPYAVMQLSQTFTLSIEKAQHMLDYNPPFSQDQAFKMTVETLRREDLQ